MLKVQDPTGKMLKVGFMILPERSGNFQPFQHFVTHHISNIPRWKVTKDNYLNKRSHTQPKPVFRSADKPFPWLPLERWLAKQKVIYILSCIGWRPHFNAFHLIIFDIVDPYEKSLTHFCYDRNIAAIGRSSSLHLWCHTKVKPGKSIPCTFTQHSNCIIK